MVLVVMILCLAGSGLAKDLKYIDLGRDGEAYLALCDYPKMTWASELEREERHFVNTKNFESNRKKHIITMVSIVVAAAVYIYFIDTGPSYEYVHKDEVKLR
jgi:hypothetical protein